MADRVATAGAAGAFDAVREAARAHDYDRYAAALLAPREARLDLIALAAFVGEVRRVPLTSHDVSIGEIRLQWWRDAIAAFGEGGRTGSPVADTLHDVFLRRELPRPLLLAVVEGRSRELYEDGIEDEAAFEHYLEETEGAAFRLGAVVLGAGADQAVDELASAAAGAYGRTRLALDLPRHIEKQRLPLPAARYLGRDPRGLDMAGAREVLVALTRQLGVEARSELHSIVALQETVAKGIFAAFLPIVLIAPYWRQLLAPRHDVLLEVADISPLERLSRLWLASWRGRLPVA